MEIAPNLEAAILDGYQYYYGKPCKHHPKSARYTSSSHCVACNRYEGYLYQKHNKEAISERKRKHYQNNPDRYAKYRQTKKERGFIDTDDSQMKAWRERERERIKARLKNGS